MIRNRSHSTAVRVAESFLLAVALCLGGCGPKSPFYQPGDDNGSGPSVVFQLPNEGATVSAVTTMSATGGGVFRVDFELNTKLVHVATASPFEWTLDPKDYVIGPQFKYRVRLRAYTTSGEVRKTIDITLGRSVPNEDVQAAIDALSPGEWYEVPNSRIAQVAWDDPDTYGPYAAIIRAASGGAFDTERNRLLVFGGGETYGGNEIYAFDVDQSTWIRLTDPSVFPPDDPENKEMESLHPDGRPVARHTYDVLEYLPPPVDRFFVSHAGALFSGSTSDPLTHYFDFDTLEWESSVAEHETTVGYAAITALAPDGRIWMQPGGGSAGSVLEIYDPTTKSWTRHAAFSSGTIGLSSTGEIDPNNMVFLATGSGVTYQWDLTDPEKAPSRLVTTGATEIEGTRNPGFAFHPPSGRLFAWGGGREVYSLDVGVAVWERHVPSGAVDPGAQSDRGTYGRWRYVPSRDVFIVVNDVEKNVFIYRPPVID